MTRPRSEQRAQYQHKDRKVLSPTILSGLLGLALAACGGSGGGSNGGSGGQTSGHGGGSGGSVATGGTASSGGTNGSGGSNSSGGKPSAGGSVTSGGSQSNGGTTTSNSGSGGTTATGGTNNDKGGSLRTGGNASGGNASGGTGGKGGTGSGGTGSVGNGSGGTGGSSTVACPTAQLQSGDSNKTVSVGGTNRTYVLHVPSAYNGTKPVPLILDFHGITGSGAAQQASTTYKAVTDSEGVITAYPNGLPGPYGAAWNVGPCCVANVDDVAFARALVADVERTACIDTKHVYAIGYSMGGGMSHYIGCHAADVFAAVAPAAFDLLSGNVDGCTPSRPMPIIIFRSTTDGIVPYNGGDSSLVPGMPIHFLGAKATFQKWSQIDQCSGTPSAEDSNGCSTYSSCGGSAQVTLCTTQGGGHDEGKGNIGWPYLKKFSLP